MGVPELGSTLDTCLPQLLSPLIINMSSDHWTMSDSPKMGDKTLGESSVREVVFNASGHHDVMERQYG